MTIGNSHLIRNLVMSMCEYSGRSFLQRNLVEQSWKAIIRYDTTSFLLGVSGVLPGIVAATKGSTEGAGGCSGVFG